MVRLFKEIVSKPLVPTFQISSLFEVNKVLASLLTLELKSFSQIIVSRMNHTTRKKFTANRSDYQIVISTMFADDYLIFDTQILLFNQKASYYACYHSKNFHCHIVNLNVNINQ